MKRSLFIFLLFLSFYALEAQEFIGRDEESIRKIMTEKYPELILDGKVKNDSFRYMKYFSRNENETWLIFIDGKGRCNGVRITCDSSILPDKRRELNIHYKSLEKDVWTYRSDGDDISVCLEDETWFFTVTHRRKQQKEKGGNDRAA